MDYIKVKTYGLLGTNSMRSTPKCPLKHFKWFTFSANMFLVLSKTEHALQSGSVLKVLFITI